MQADAAPPSGSFNVSTTITSSCTLTNSGPSDLTPTYTVSTDSGVGSATTLNTSCNGSTPSVSFTDLNGGSGSEFVMVSGSSPLYYQLSNNTSCSGTFADSPFSYNTPVSLATGSSSLNICAAVVAGNGTNTSAPSGNYTDTVYYTISP